MERNTPVKHELICTLLQPDWEVGMPSLCSWGSAAAQHHCSRPLRMLSVLCKAPERDGPLMQYTSHPDMQRHNAAFCILKAFRDFCYLHALQWHF